MTNPSYAAIAGALPPAPAGAFLTCMIVFIVSNGNMKECSATPAKEPATTCCAARTG